MEIRFRFTPPAPGAPGSALVQPEWLVRAARAAGLHPQELPFEVREVRVPPVAPAGRAAPLEIPFATPGPVQPLRVVVVDPDGPEPVWHTAVPPSGDAVMAPPGRLPPGARQVYIYLRNVLSRREPELFWVRREGSQLLDLPWRLHSHELPATGPIALILHGFASRSEANFESLKHALLDSGAYSGVLGYTYPTAMVSIRASGEKLAQVLHGQGLLAAPGRLDLYAHSEGGLVCRSLLAYEPHRGAVRTLMTAGTPHLGTPMAKLGDMAWDLIAGGLSEMVRAAQRGLVEMAAALMQSLVRAIMGQGSRENPGLEDMVPQSHFLSELNSLQMVASPPSTGLFVAATHLNLAESGWVWREFYDQVFGAEPHDGVVPEASGARMPGMAPTRIPMAPGHHGAYFGQQERARQIVLEVLRRM